MAEYIAKGDNRFHSLAKDTNIIKQVQNNPYLGTGYGNDYLPWLLQNIGGC